MKQSFVNAQQLPLIIEPNGNGNSKQELLAWLKANKTGMNEKFIKHGAILFRGFEINNPNDFEDLAVVVDPRLEHAYYGTSPRNLVKGTKHVFTASELPGHYPIMQHCEMSYVKNPPVNIFFYCHVEPDYGGESPICNFRKVYADMDPKIREEFDRKGVLTVRNYSGLDGGSKFNLFELKKWNEIFNTTDKAEVEKQCREQEIEFEWMPDGNLRLVHRTPAAINHPVTKEKVWFNHLQVFHPHGADVEYAYIHQHQQRGKTFFWKVFLNLMVKLKSVTTKPIDQSMNVLFGDGTPVPDSYVEHIEELIWKNLVILPWKQNDVIAVDNFSTAHGRLPYEGKREILVCWSTQ
ncbi:MAG TPA: TauD/TfdA family dioxygenase [Chitinophagales bacterium]|nr:TauD/TfdA family dioxygenase [Chitinophagales bacterium]